MTAKTWRRARRRVGWVTAYVTVLAVSLGLFLAGLHSCSAPAETPSALGGVEIRREAR